MSNYKALFGALVLTSSLLLASEQALVTRVVDGDTMHMKSTDGKKYKCRILGIDTPEKYGGSKLNKDVKRARISKKNMMELGKRATAFAKSVFGDEDTLYDVEIVGADIYKRKLCVIHLQDKTYNESVVLAGFATVYKRGKYTKDKLLRDKINRAQADAMENKRGLWQDYYDVLLRLAD